MEKSFHMLLYRAFHAQRGALRPCLTEVGLGTGQPKLLGYLSRNGPSCQRQLADYFEIDPAAVCRMLDSLQKGGFVTRCGDGQDKRRGRVEITPAGQAAYDAWESCCRGMEEIGAQIERETGCTVEVKLGISYPAVWNHAELLESVRHQLGSEAPAVLETPAMAAEDFSFYQRQVPGVFFFLGTGATPPLHAQNFDFDDAAVLPAGAAFFEKLLGLS